MANVYRLHKLEQRMPKGRISPVEYRPASRRRGETQGDEFP